MNQGQIDIEKIQNGLNRLVQLREHLLKEPLSQEGAWIHKYTVYRKYPNGFEGRYYYAKWQAEKPIFKRNPKPRGRLPKRNKDPEYTCHLHIGRVESNTGLGCEPEVTAAYKSWDNRKKLEAIEKALRDIQTTVAKTTDFLTDSQESDYT